MSYKSILGFILKYKLFFLIFFTVLVFFWPVAKGHIPFPGDNLVASYEPYRAYPLLGYNPGSVPTKGQGPDVIRELFPWKFFAIESLKSGEIPFWNPHNFSGNPLMANFQSAVFYPLNVFFFFLPFNISWSLFIFLIPLLSFFFTYLFLKEIKLSSASSFFGGLIFSFSSYMVVWMEYGNIGHTLLWLPLLLFLVEKIIKKFDYKTLLFFILILWTSILGGYIQGYFYASVFVFLYFIYKSKIEKKLILKKFIIFSFVLILPAVLSLFQILPTLDLFKASSRSDYTLNQIQNLLNPWWYSITAVVPNFFGNPASSNHWFYGTYIERVSYIGLVPFVFFLSSLFSFRKNKEILFFAFLGIFCFIISIDIFVTKYFFKIPIPVLSTTVPTRILSIYQFCAAILAAFGFEQLLKKEKLRQLCIVILGVFIIIAFSWLFVLFLGKKLSIGEAYLSVSQKNLIIPTFLLVLTVISVFAWIRFKKNIAVFILILITTADLFYFFHKITPFSPQEFVYPKTPVIEFIKENASINRFWGYGSGYVDSNFQTADGTFSPEGNDPLHIKEYTELLSSSNKGVVPKILPRPDANIAAGYGEGDLKQNEYRKRILNLLGVKFILHKSDNPAPDTSTFPESQYKFAYADGYYQVYENKDVLPRFFLTGEFEVLTDKKEILKKIYDSSRNPKSLIVNDPPVLRMADDPESSSDLIIYNPNEVLIKTKSKENNFLFISDTYFPDWRAKIDGKDSKIILADYSFRAVEVPKGIHEVEFYYSPESFKKGISYSILGVILLAFFILYVKKNKI